jgi:hypothetical protein
MRGVQPAWRAASVSAPQTLPMMATHGAICWGTQGGLLAQGLKRRASNCIGSRVGGHRTWFVELPSPCFFPEIQTNPKGKARKIYRYETMITPYDELKSLPRATVQLNPGGTFAILDAIAHQFSDTQVAGRLQTARLQLFTTIHDHTQNASRWTHHRLGVQTHLRIGKYCIRVIRCLFLHPGGLGDSETRICRNKICACGR